MTPEATAQDRFTQDTSEHEMAVLRDDGLYRHLRFQKPGTSMYYFDLVTWPGYLAVVGDCGDYMFSRIRDMFEFFESHGRGINPQYWAEKLQGPGGDVARSYSVDVFRARVRDWADTLAEELTEDETQSLRGALAEQVLVDPWGELQDEHEAHRRLCDFEHAGVRIRDSWEWDLREYDFRFLWCCWATVWGIGQYRAATLTEAMAS